MEKSALVYILLSVTVVGLALFVDSSQQDVSFLSRGKARNFVAEFAVFALLTGVSACRIAVGNDYWPYRFNFNLIAQERHVSSEFGFNLIVKGMNALFGYDNYLPIFALFSILTVLFFSLALHEQATDYAMTVFLLMTGGYYFNSLNSVRYYLALAIALFSMNYVLGGEWEKFIFWILVGSMFHKSILLVVPVYFCAGFLASKKLKTWHYVLLGTGFAAAVLFGKNLIREVIFLFYPYYRNSDFDNGRISYVNVLKCAAVLVLCLIFSREGMKRDLKIRFYFFLNVFGLLAYCCGSFLPEISRVGYYMIISQIFLIPQVLKGIEAKKIRYFCCAGVVMAFSVYFVFLLRGMYAVDVRLLPYRNWIFD